MSRCAVLFRAIKSPTQTEESFFEKAPTKRRQAPTTQSLTRFAAKYTRAKIATASFYALPHRLLLRREKNKYQAYGIEEPLLLNRIGRRFLFQRPLVIAFA